MKESIPSLRNKAISLLKSLCSQDVVDHSLAVSKNAMRIARRLKEQGYDVDLDFIEIASLLHDIGRSKTHGIRHGIEGSKILKESNLSRFSKVCETHIGGGITREEARMLGLPERDYLPKSLEEKIIAHADNITIGTETVSIEKTVEKLQKRLGKDHPAIKRVMELNDFIESMRNI